MAAMLVVFSAITAWPQATLSRVNGKVTDGGKPLAGAQIVYTNLGTGKTFKDKTSKDGTYNMVVLSALTMKSKSAAQPERSFIKPSARSQPKVAENKPLILIFPRVRREVRVGSRR